MRTASGRRPLAAALLACGLATSGCAAGHPAAHRAAATSAPHPPAAASPANVAAAQLARAEQVMSGLRSYAFRTVATLAGGTAAPPTVVAGRIIRPEDLAYTITAGGRTEQVVQVGTAGYVRVGNAAWRRGQARATDPLASLLAVLRAFTSRTVAPSAAGYVLRGQVPLRLVGQVPAGVSRATEVPATLVIDGAGHVTEVSVSVLAAAGARTVRGHTTTTFSAFDAVPRVTAPR